MLIEKIHIPFPAQYRRNEGVTPTKQIETKESLSVTRDGKKRQEETPDDGKHEPAENELSSPAADQSDLAARTQNSPDKATLIDVLA
jgi:hypothetical protein